MESWPREYTQRCQELPLGLARDLRGVCCTHRHGGASLHMICCRCSSPALPCRRPLPSLLRQVRPSSFQSLQTVPRQQLSDSTEAKELVDVCIMSGVPVHVERVQLGTVYSDRVCQ